MKKKSNKFITIILIIVLIVGVSLLLFPTVSDYWNSFHQTKVIAKYSEEVAKLDKKKHDEFLTAAQNYNKALYDGDHGFSLSSEQREKYKSMLDVTGLGIMGYIEIPKIGCTLPIYHGTEESVLQIGVGHLEWSSLPIGGRSSHCVLSGHSGLPTSKLFTNLDKLTEGDTFMIRVIDEILTYEVDRIMVVEPQETSPLCIVDGEDYCTLVTCTPYGVNTHRLLVRGRRIDNIEESRSVRATSNATQIEPMIVASVVAVPVLLVILILLLMPRRSRKKHGGNDDETS